MKINYVIAAFNRSNRARMSLETFYYGANEKFNFFEKEHILFKIEVKENGYSKLLKHKMLQVIKVNPSIRIFITV